MCRPFPQVLAIALIAIWGGGAPASAEQAPAGAPAPSAAWNSLMPGWGPWTPAGPPMEATQAPPAAVAPPAPLAPAAPPTSWATEPAARGPDGIGFQAAQWLAPPARPRTDWYARVDYFSWREYVDFLQVLEETGPLVSVGYLREGVYSRIRAELFVGSMRYDGETMDGVPLTSDTGYFGGRFELDAPFRIEGPRGFVELFAGLGTRLWNRDLAGGVDAIDRPVISYQENWWTVYAYLGVGVSRALSPTLELYSSARLGATVYTWEHMSLWDVTMEPRPGFAGAMEFGLRGERLALAVRMETTAWAESAVVPVAGEWFGALQPESRMATVGLSLAYTY